MADDGQLVPASEAAYLMGEVREVIVRRVQRGQLAGELRDGKWYVQQAAIDQHHAQQKAAVDQIRADAAAARATKATDEAARQKRIEHLQADHRSELPESVRGMAIGGKDD